MSEYRPTLTHTVDGLDRLIERFKGRPNLEALLRVVLARVQHIDDVLWDLYSGVWLDNAVGAQLDSLGWVVGEARKSRSDDLYKLYIRARIRVNRANGQIKDSLAVARLLVENTATVEYVPEYPAAYRVRVSNTAISAAALGDLLQQVKPAGVQLTAEVVGDLTNALIWDDVGAAHLWDAGLWSDTI